MKKIIFILLLVGLAAFIAWFMIGCLTSPDDGIIKSPKVDSARYIITVANTGEVIYTDNVEIIQGPDTEIADDTYVVHGFWEASGSQFVYRDGSIIMKEAIFGKIKIKERVS